jgi:hypothetical protein
MIVGNARLVAHFGPLHMVQDITGRRRRARSARRGAGKERAGQRDQEKAESRYGKCAFTVRSMAARAPGWLRESVKRHGTSRRNRTESANTARSALVGEATVWPPGRHLAGRSERCRRAQWRQRARPRRTPALRPRQPCDARSAMALAMAGVCSRSASRSAAAALARWGADDCRPGPGAGSGRPGVPAAWALALGWSRANQPGACRVCLIAAARGAAC